MAFPSIKTKRDRLAAGLFSMLWVWGSLSTLACKPSLTVTVNDAGAGKLSQVQSLTPLIAKVGETVEFKGQGLRKNLKLTLNGESIPLSVDSATEGHFEMPALTPGLKSAIFSSTAVVSGSFTILADTATDGLTVMPLNPSEVCAGVSYYNGEGLVQAGTRTCADTDVQFCHVDGGTNCITSESLPAISVEALQTELPKIHETISIAGVYGTMKDCGGGQQTGCYINPNLTMKALIGDAVDVTKILKSYTDLGITGNLGDCSIAGSSTCFATGTFFAAETCTVNASSCYLPPYQASSQKLKAVDVDAITPGVIKKNEVVALVTGQYPNASYPLAVTDGLSDLTLANFESLLPLSTSFAWFDRYGNRLSHAGDVGLASGFIKGGVSIFGVVGNQYIPAPWDVRKATAFGSSLSGKLPTLCNNRNNLSLWDVFLPPVLPQSGLLVDDLTDIIRIPSHGFTTGNAVRLDYYGGTPAPAPIDAASVYYVIRVDNDNFKLAASHADAVAGTPTPIDITAAGEQVIVYRINSGVSNYFNTLDDYNNGLTASALTTWPGSEAQVCEGLEATDGDDKVWRETSVALCSAAPGSCRMKDKISELEWTALINPGTNERPWAQALMACDTLIYDTKTDWRLPTQKELLDAYAHGMQTAAAVAWIAAADFNYGYWAATTAGLLPAKAYEVNLANGSSSQLAKSSSRRVLCVRKD